MTPPNRRAQSTKEERRRAKQWAAKQRVHEELQHRKVRDNIISAISLVVGVAAVGILTSTYYLAGPGSSSAASSSAAASSAAASSSTGANSGDVPDSSLSEDRTWTGSMLVNGQTVDFTLDGAAAPQAVASFISLAEEGFYEGLTCHRLVDQDDFHILQCGDPEGDGTGGPGYSYGPIENAPDDEQYSSGVIAMARTSDNAYSQGSQFFIVFGDSTIPDDSVGGYTVIGSITSGLDVITDIAAEGVADGTDSTPAETVTLSDITVE